MGGTLPSKWRSGRSYGWLVAARGELESMMLSRQNRLQCARTEATTAVESAACLLHGCVRAEAHLLEHRDPAGL
eukprot:1241748-Amphidinium_carterae.1